MKNLNITISELEYNKFGLKKEEISFSEFIDIVKRELAKQALERSVRLAKKYGLADMTMDDITKEVKAVRNAKNR